jgi:predicted TIM-barrel fold metal-dependent hydrolase
MTKKQILALLLLYFPQRALAQEEVFDIHVHLWSGEKSIKEYVSQLESTTQGVTRFGGMLIAQKGQLSKTRQKNDELIALAAKYPKLLPIASVHPYDGQAATGELKRLAGLGVKAIKLHAHTQKFDIPDPRVLDLCKQAGELGIVVLMDNANIIPGDSENLFNLAVKCGKTKFVFTHMGGLNFRFWNILPLARTAKDFFMDNIYFDISATMVLAADSPLEEEFIWTIRNVGIDRVILGSDYPQISLAQAVNALQRLDLDQRDKDKIRYENARKLFLRNDQ